MLISEGLQMLGSLKQVFSLTVELSVDSWAGNTKMALEIRPAALMCQTFSLGQVEASGAYLKQGSCAPLLS